MGDVILIESERLLVTAVNNDNTIAVTFAFENTTQANHANNLAVTLITNARDGADVDADAMSRLPSTVVQYSQTVQHAYQVGGTLQSTGNYMDGRSRRWTGTARWRSSTSWTTSRPPCIFGKGTTGGISSTLSNQTMKGFQTLITTNNTLAADELFGLQADRLHPRHAAGVLQQRRPAQHHLCQPGLPPGMAQWGWTIQRLDQPVNELGIAADTSSCRSWAARG